jgi:hypothetical protein
MFDQSTKIIAVTNIYETVYTDWSTALLTTNNTAYVEFNKNLDLYIGRPTPFYRTYFWLESYTATLSGLVVKYYKNGTTPSWTTITAGQITDTTSGFNNSGVISFPTSSATSWIPTTVWTTTNYYWLKLTIAGTGHSNFLNVFNNITTVENIMLDGLPQLRVIPYYCVVMRPNKPIIGD